MSRPYNEQRRILKALQTETDAKGLLDIGDSIDTAERLERVVLEIYECAKKNREFCLHCDSIAKVIEDSRK